MKPPWQARPQQFVTTAAPDHSQLRSSSVRQAQPISNTPVVLSHMYGHHHHEALQHPAYLTVYSKPSEQLFHFDPRSGVSALGGAPRSYSSSTQPTLHPTYQPRRSAPHRVSLLRDIGIAGERDRDVCGSSTLSADLHGPTGHASAALSHGGLGRPIDRSSPAMSSAARPSSYQFHAASHGPAQDLSQMRHAAVNTPQSYVDMPHPADIKKEPSANVKQEFAGKLTGHSLSDLPEQHSAQHMGLHSLQSSVLSSKSDYGAAAETGLVEQKSKENLAQAMVKLDREISKVEKEIDRLQKKKTQLEENSKQPPEPEKDDTSQQRVEPKHRDLWQVIYAENRKKAEAVRNALEGLCHKPSMQAYTQHSMPLYNQPCDTQVYQDNIKKNEEMRPKLLKYFQRYAKLRSIRERYLCARYDQLMEDWQRKTEEIESNPKRKAKEAKTREFLEKLFPEVRKQREQQERIDRHGTRGDACRSEADFAEIVDGLSEQENQLQNMRQLAVIPPMLLDNEQRRVKFVSENGYIREPLKEFKESQQLDLWSDEEKDIFKEKYISHPKNFHLIASFIEKKSVADCILYYYLTKKTNHYKALVRKQTLKPKKVKSGRAHASHNEQSGTKDDKLEKDEVKREVEPEAEEPRIEKPPSPRMTRARKQTMNWTEEEISLVKGGFEKYGRDFSSISRMLNNKSEQQVKNFYHNYKKKYALDQLITESKKKKTNESRRTRNQAQSPETAVVTKEDDIADRKTADSSSTDEKKAEKDKAEETSVAEEKRSKSKDRAPSPFYPTGKLLTDASDPAPLVTTQIRTRRTAALAAAASAPQESASADTAAGSKRPASDKSATATQEPAEKKPKKSERRRKEKSNSESSSKDVVKTEFDKPETKAESAKVEAASAADKKPAADPATPDKKEGMADANEQESDAKQQVTASASRAQKDAASEKKATAGVAKTSLEDHDSSATCSADEDGAQEPVVWKIKEKGPADAYDFNDSPTIIRLETARPSSSASSNSATASSALSSSSSAFQTTARVDPLVLTLANKAVNVLPTSASSSRPVTIARPQSLPPPAATPPPPPSSATVRTTAMVTSVSTVSAPAVSASRPSSTPGPLDLMDKTPSTTAGNAEPAGPVTRPPSMPAAVPILPPRSAPPHATTAASSATVVEDIRKLVYTGPPGKVVFPPGSGVKTFAVSVPHVMDLTTSDRTSLSRHLTPASIATVKVEAPATICPPSRPLHPVASNLQKDFDPSTVTLPSAGHTIPAISSSVHRSYSEKDIRAMKEKAAVTPPVPVSALRFTTAKPAIISQSHRTVSASTALKQILDTKPSDVKGPILLPSGLPQGAIRLPLVNPSPQDTSVTYPISVGGVHVRTIASTSNLPVASPNLVSIRHGKPPPQLSLLDAKKETEKLQPPKVASIVRTSLAQTVQMVASSAPPLQQSLVDTVPSAKSIPVISQPSVIPSHIPVFPPSLYSRAFRIAPTLPTGAAAPFRAERPPDPQSLSKLPPSSSEDPRFAIAPSLQAGALHASPNPPYSMAAHLPFHPGGMEYRTPLILDGSSVSRKRSKDASPSPKPVIHAGPRTASPPAALHATKPPKSSAAKLGQHESDHHSPYVQGEKTLGEASKRSDSGAHISHQRQPRGGSEPALLGALPKTHSPHSLPGASKNQTSALLQEARSTDDILPASQPAVSLLGPRFFSASNPLRLPYVYSPLLPGPTASKTDLNALMQQYHLPGVVFPGIPGMPPYPPTSLVRTFSPNSSDALESSRHLYTQDFSANAQRMHNPAARGSPFPTSVASIPASPVIVTNPAASPLVIPPRHAGSPTSADRTSFIQRPGNTASPHSSRSSANPSRNTMDPKSPSSPLTPHHPAAKAHFPSGTPQSFPIVPEMLRPGIERRRSSSPRATPSSDHYSPTIQSALTSQIAARDPRGTPPTPYGTPPPSRLTPQPKSYATPDVLEQFPPSRALQNSPGLQHPGHRSSSPKVQPPRVKREGPQNEPVDPQRLVAIAEAQKRDRQQAQQAAAERQRKEHQNLRAMHGQRVSSEKPVVVQEQRKDATDVHNAAARTTQYESAAKDLKLKGRATMTPANLINAIIDHKIIQELGAGLVQLPKDLAGGALPIELTGGASRRSPSQHQPPRPNPTEAPGQVLKQAWTAEQPKTSNPSSAQRAQRVDSPGVHYVPNPTVATSKTLAEHSHDVIANIYGKETEMKRQLMRQEQQEQRAERSEISRQTAKPASMVTSFPRHEAEVLHSREQMAPAHYYMQHPLVPFPVGDTAPCDRLENIIRNALMDSAQSSRSASPVARGDMTSRSPRPDMSTNRASPNVPTNQGDTQQPNRIKPVEQKRSEPATFKTGGGNNQQPSAAPRYISALQLSVKAGQNTGTTQQHATAGNVPSRQPPSAGSASSGTPHLLSSGTSFHARAHSPAGAPPPERTVPMPTTATAYESLSDSD